MSKQSVEQREADDVPTAVWSGSFVLFGVEVRCHTLSDGRRIIEAESFERLMGAMADDVMDYDSPELHRFAAWRSGGIEV